MRFDEETFKQEFNQTHGDKYEYLGYEHGKVKFKCNIHNIIQEDTPSHLRSGRGCKICSKEAKIAKSASTTEEFIAKAKAIHGEKYDYSKVRYVKNDEKVTIICPKHGEFLQTPMTHLRGNGCQKCGYETIGRKLKRSEPLKSPHPRKTTEDFIKQATELQNGFYGYSKSVYVNDKTPLVITCPIHGDFLQTPNKHLQGQGCPKCSQERLKEEKQGNFSVFLTKFKDKFGIDVIFPYISSEYVNNKSNITVKCPKCGASVKRTPNYLLTFGYTCHNCSNEQNISYEALVKESKCQNIEAFDGEIPIKGGKVALICKKHGKYVARVKSVLKGKWKCKLCSMEEAISKHKLPFDEVERRILERFKGQITLEKETFRDTMSPMTMKCNVCGNSFERSPNCAIFAPLKHACPHCGALKVKEKRTKTLEDFINKAEKVHGKGKYDFSETKYVRSSEKVRIKCNDCGRVFEIEANSFLNGHGCPYHNCNSSLMEKEIADFITSLNKETETNNRKLLEGKEIDIFLPTEMIAFEFNGIFWHNDTNKTKEYHQEKSLKCLEKGIRLVHIFENEWIRGKEKYKWFIKCVLKAFPEVLSAFNCVCKQLTNREGESFLEANSVGIFKKAENYVSYMLNDEIVGVFGYTNKTLLSYCLKIDKGIEGLLSRFIREYCILECDIPFSIGVDRELFDNGFVVESISEPNRFETATTQRKTYYAYDCGYIRLIKKVIDNG